MKRMKRHTFTDQADYTSLYYYFLKLPIDIRVKLVGKDSL